MPSVGNISPDFSQIANATVTGHLFLANCHPMFDQMGCLSGFMENLNDVDVIGVNAANAQTH
jgi:hypothetical protein